MSKVDMTGLYDNLPDNSHAARIERKQETAMTTPASSEKRTEKIVKGKVRKKKNDLRKLTDIFISEDVVNVKSYVLMDVIVPAVKKALYESIVNSVNMILYGGRGGDSKRSNVDRFSYTSYSDPGRRDDRRRDSYDSYDRSYDDFILETRAEAEKVLSAMDDIMEAYDVVRVADLFDMFGETCPHTMYKYGWTNIRNAEIVPVRGGGYRIKMPRALPIR